MKALCNHLNHGDFVNGYWLCGQCYSKIQDRPYRLFTQPTIGGTGSARQEVEYAKVIAADGGLTLSLFVAAIARKLVAIGSFPMPDAIDYAIDILVNMGEEFGSRDVDWGITGAWELVKEDQQYWDADEDLDEGSNK